MELSNTWVKTVDKYPVESLLFKTAVECSRILNISQFGPCVSMLLVNSWLLRFCEKKRLFAFEDSVVYLIPLSCLVVLRPSSH